MQRRSFWNTARGLEGGPEEPAAPRFCRAIILTVQAMQTVPAVASTEATPTLGRIHEDEGKFKSGPFATPNLIATATYALFNLRASTSPCAPP